MIFILVLGGLIVLAVLLGVLADYRARRHGRRFGNWNTEAIQNRVDIEATQRAGPVAQGRTQDWMTFRRRNQQPGKSGK
jgi:hypothetical protein